MPGKRVQIDEETWQALHQLALDSVSSFQDLAEEAFADLLRKHKRPVGFRAQLKASATADAPPKRGRHRARAIGQPANDQ